MTSPESQFATNLYYTPAYMPIWYGSSQSNTGFKEALETQKNVTKMVETQRDQLLLEKERLLEHLVYAYDNLTRYGYDDNYKHLLKSFEDELDNARIEVGRRYRY